MIYQLMITSLIVRLISLPSYAGHSRHHSNYDTGYFYDYAKVRSVTPIIETVERRVPRGCRHTNHHTEYHRSATPAILGGIIGAAIGNELGHHKSSQRVGAVAGGILGASIGADINRRQQPYHRCETQYTIEYEEQVVGYDVSYRYRGQTYYTQTQEHPGKKVQLKLRFEPVLY